MKRFRLLAFLCAIIFLLSATTVSVAETKHLQVKTTTTTFSKAVGWHNNRIIKNREKVTFVVYPAVWCLYEKSENGYQSYDNIIFDFAGKVTGKTYDRWILIEPTKGGFILSFEQNRTLKTRTGKVTVTGSGFKVTLIIKQLATDRIVSVKRNKDKVTVKFKQGNASVHYLNVWTTDLNLYDSTFIGSSYTFKVKKGLTYHISTGPAIMSQWGGYNWTNTCWCSFTVNSLSGTETYSFDNYF